MKLLVNGETKDFNFGNLTISDLLKIENIKNPEVVTVQVNGKFFSKEQYPSTILKDGDEVEFLYFIGGGK